MKISVPYDKDSAMTAVLSDTVNTCFLEANDVVIPDQSRVIADAIHLPVNSQSFDVFLADAGRVLVIVNDATRPTPTAKVLDTIFEPLSKTDFRFIIATGVHRGPSEEEFVQIFGKYYPQIKDRIIVHDAKRMKIWCTWGIPPTAPPCT